MKRSPNIANDSCVQLERTIYPPGRSLLLFPHFLPTTRKPGRGLRRRRLHICKRAALSHSGWVTSKCDTELDRFVAQNAHGLQNWYPISLVESFETPDV